MRALLLGLSIVALAPASVPAQTLKLPPIRATFKSTPRPATPVQDPFPFGTAVHGMPTLDPRTFVGVPGMQRTASPEAPIDCAMVRRTHRNVDPNMPVVQPPAGVVLMMRTHRVLPCRQ